MPILVRCACDEEFQVGDHLAGQVVRCPVCGHRETVPTSVASTKGPAKAPKSRAGVILAVVLALILAGGSIYGVARIVKPPLDSGQRLVYEHLMRFDDDPSSVEVVEWRPTVKARPSSAYIDYDSAVYATIRSKNKNGAMVVEPRLFLILGRKVVAMEICSQGNIVWSWEANRIYDPGQKVVDPLGQKLNDLANEKPGP